LFALCQEHVRLGCQSSLQRLDVADLNSCHQYETHSLCCLSALEHALQDAPEVGARYLLFDEDMCAANLMFGEAAMQL
jgi:hypothetical protein